MVDAAGTTSYTYDSAGLLLSEDGPWANETVSYAYTNTLRTRLTAQRSGTTDWKLGYTYDGVNRLRFLSVPTESTVEYRYAEAGDSLPLVSRLPRHVAFEQCFTSRAYDGLARLTSIGPFNYTYNAASQRTRMTDTGGGSLVDYGYDGLGQLTNAAGRQVNGGAPRAHEQWAYQYDRSGNLAQRVKSGLVETLDADANNQLTGASASGTFTVTGMTTPAATQVTVNSQPAQIYADHSWALANVPLTNTSITAVATDGQGNASSHSIHVNLATPRTYQYDLNGNLFRRGQAGGSGALAGSFGTSTLSLVASRSLKDMRATRFASGAKIHGAIASLPPAWTRPSDGRRTFSYDSENQLIQVSVTNRPNLITKSDCVYDARGRRRVRSEAVWLGAAWFTNQVVRYIYDGNLVLQERDTNNTVRVSYIRGQDLSGTLDGAGGIGGLIALYYGFGTQAQRYLSDANGNVTGILDYNGNLIARYRYDPFGNLIAQSESFAETNLHRFSSKEFHPQSGLYYYGRRFYDPGLQRWLNRDPIGEKGGVNLFRIAGNAPLNRLDAWGLLGITMIEEAVSNPWYVFGPGKLRYDSAILSMGGTFFGVYLPKVHGDWDSRTRKCSVAFDRYPQGEVYSYYLTPGVYGLTSVIKVGALTPSGAYQTVIWRGMGVDAAASEAIRAHERKHADRSYYFLLNQLGSLEIELSEFNRSPAGRTLFNNANACTNAVAFYAEQVLTRFERTYKNAAEGQIRAQKLALDAVTILFTEIGGFMWYKGERPVLDIDADFFYDAYNGIFNSINSEYLKLRGQMKQ